MSQLYPTSLSELDNWRRQAGTTLDEARKRFVQFLVLQSVAEVPGLRESLMFKGGNALRFVYGNPRSTIDLDFTAVASFPDDEGQIRSQMDSALTRGGQRFGVKMKCQKVKRNPKRNPKNEATLPTFQVTVGYQLPGDRYFADFEQVPHVITTVVNVEISLNDLVCETMDHPLLAGEGQIRVCVLEDIMAEKLRALLQQKVRNRTRPQDVFDLARVLLDHGTSLDRAKIAEYLLRKSAARAITACKSAFDDPEVRRRAALDYESLAQETQAAIIPFAEAWKAVLELIGGLQIPE